MTKRQFRLFTGETVDMTQDTNHGDWGTEEASLHPSMLLFDRGLTTPEALKAALGAVAMDLGVERPPLPVATHRWPWWGGMDYSRDSRLQQASETFYYRMQAVHDLVALADTERAVLEAKEPMDGGFSFLGEDGHWITNDFMLGRPGLRPSGNSNRILTAHETYGIGRNAILEGCDITPNRVRSYGKEDDSEMGVWLYCIEDMRKFLLAMHDAVVKKEVESLLMTGATHFWTVSMGEAGEKKERTEVVMEAKTFKTDKSVVAAWAKGEGACSVADRLFATWDEKLPLEWWYATLEEADRATAWDWLFYKTPAGSEVESALQGNKQPHEMPWKIIREYMGLAPWPKLGKRVKTVLGNFNGSGSRKTEKTNFMGLDIYMRQPTVGNPDEAVSPSPLGSNHWPTMLLERALGLEETGRSHREDLADEVATLKALIGPEHEWGDDWANSRYILGQYSMDPKGHKAAMRTLRIVQHIYQHRLEAEKVVVPAVAEAPKEPTQEEWAEAEAVRLGGRKSNDISYRRERVWGVEVASVRPMTYHWDAVKIQGVDPILFHWASRIEDESDVEPFEGRRSGGPERTPLERAILQHMLRERMNVLAAEKIETKYLRVSEGLFVPETPGVACELRFYESWMAEDTRMWEELARVCEAFMALGEE